MLNCSKLFRFSLFECLYALIIHSNFRGKIKIYSFAILSAFTGNYIAFLENVPAYHIALCPFLGFVSRKLVLLALSTLWNKLQGNSN